MRYLLKLLLISIFGLLVFIGCGGDEATGPEIDYSREQEIAEKAVSVYNNLSDSLDIRKALHQVLDTLNKIDEVEKASMGADSLSVWWSIKEGLRYVLPTVTAASYIDSTSRSSKNTRPNTKELSVPQPKIRHDPHNKQALVLSPYYWEFKNFAGYAWEDETDSVVTLLNSAGYNTTYKRNDQKADQNIILEDFRHFNDYGVIEIITHGAVNPEGKVGISTGIELTQELRNYFFLEGLEDSVAVDVDHHDLVLLSGWFNYSYLSPLENTLLNINGCKSLYNQSLASEITGKGSVFFGWDYTVLINYATNTGTDLFYQLIVRGLNAGEAWQQVLEDGYGIYNNPFEPWTPNANYNYYQGTNGLEIEIPGGSVEPGTPGTEKWAFSTGDAVYSSPAIGPDGTIYVGSGDNNLYAINPDGTQKWAFSAEGGVYSSPAIGSDGTIYVGSNDNNLYAINPDGSEKWKFLTGSIVPSSPSISSDGTIYMVYDENFYAINPNGTQKWSFSTGNVVYSSPAIGSDGTIYVGDAVLYAINPDGTQKWTSSTGISSSAAVDLDGTIYVGSDDNNLYAINPDGTQKWAFSTEGWVFSSPAIGSDGTIYAGSDDNNLYSINPDGSQKWVFPTADRVRHCPAIGPDGTIYVGSDDGSLYAIYGLSGGLANTPWPMFLHDLRHSGRVGGP